MPYLSVLIILVLFSCGDEKIIQLPEIKNADITEVLDVSPAYIFYDETQPDSTLFNRKNLISTTNWLVNVDKRLTLKQAIPHLQYLQSKRRKASMHKNENAKNYFTCNNTSIKNLGFLEFTELTYLNKEEDFDLYIFKRKKINHLEINFFSKNQIIIKGITPSPFYENTNINNLENLLSSKTRRNPISVSCLFSRNLTFQLYITIKSKLSKLESENFIIDKNEFFY